MGQWLTIFFSRLDISISLQRKTNAYRERLKAMLKK